MTNCILCHKVLWIDSIVKSITGMAAERDFVCICFDCIKKQKKL